MTTLHYIIIFISAVLLSYCAVLKMLSWGRKKGIMDLPNERSLHSRPIIRGGGLPVVCLSLGGWLISGFLLRSFPVYAFLAYAGGAALIALVGWFDDLNPLSSELRFVVHCGAALLIIWAFGYPEVIGVPFFGEARFGWFGLLLALIWLVGLTNAYNFMDGIDGIAGGQGVVAGIGWFLLGRQGAPHPIALLGLLLAAGCLGFLGQNWPPARIFMGDVLSTFLGFTFAAMAIIAAKDDPRLVAAGALLVWPFVFDTIFTLLNRIRKGERPGSAHRSHLYQRLVIAGCSHGFVSVLYIGHAAAGAALALLWMKGFFVKEWLVYIALGVLCFTLWLSAFVITGLKDSKARVLNR